MDEPVFRLLRFRRGRVDTFEGGGLYVGGNGTLHNGEFLGQAALRYRGVRPDGDIAVFYRNGQWQQQDVRVFRYAGMRGTGGPESR